MEKTNRNLWMGIGVVIAVVAIVALIGIVALRPEPEVLMGEVAASEYRVANKVPGRLDTLYVQESQMVKAGDTLQSILRANGLTEKQLSGPFVKLLVSLIFFYKSLG